MGTCRDWGHIGTGDWDIWTGTYRDWGHIWIGTGTYWDGDSGPIELVSWCFESSQPKRITLGTGTYRNWGHIGTGDIL